MRTTLFLAALAAVLLTPLHAQEAGAMAYAPCPLAHGTWERFEPMWDEFDGDTLDAAKWHDHNPTWKGRHPAFFAKTNVAVHGGKLHLAMRREDIPGLPKGYHTFTSAAVKSKALVRYGYFEVKCRPMDSHGSSAFWFYHQTPETWTEIDMFEMGAGAPKHEHTVHMNAHVFHTLVNPDRHWSRGGKWQAPFRLADEWHVYALEWDPAELKYYVDGKVVHTIRNTHWHQPLTMNFDSETMPKWFGLPDPKDLPSTFSIEYIRSWRRTDMEEPVFRNCTLDFPSAKKGTERHRLEADADGDVVVVAKRNPQGKKAIVHLEYDAPKWFAAQKAPRIEKRIGVKDRDGKAVTFVIVWEKVKGEKRNNGYRADTVDVVPSKRPGPGQEATYTFVARSGAVAVMKLSFGGA